jgi:(p)ppGpp synthase/HD superfamily hydrolase
LENEPWARAYFLAKERHGNQMYGDENYVAGHLAEVVDVLTGEGFNSDIWIQRGWLHDILEDTETSLKELRIKFGDEVAWPVFAVSGFGRNRQERNEDIYRKLEMFGRDACILKLADRIANCERGAKNDMYRKELPKFESIVRKHVPEKMWNRLLSALQVDQAEV